MTTFDYSNYDFLAGAVENQEYRQSSWYQDQRTFARTERRCIKVYQRAIDRSHEVTLHALENVILIVLVLTNNGKQIFFDTFLDTPLLRQNVILMMVVI